MSRRAAGTGSSCGRVLLEDAPFDPRVVAAELGPEGPIARALAGYEYRHEQIEMAERVAETLESGGVLVVEAGTGTGKSLAYLVPAILWSLRHAERVIVSTNTINLQEQLLRSDLPLLAAHFGFRAALVKGRGNYLCLRKAAELRASPALAWDDAAGEIGSILEWAQQTEGGSLTELPFVPRPEAWEAVVAEHDDCLRARCPDYDRCFFYRARKEAADADLLVVNHHLLLTDLRLRRSLPAETSSGVLPPASRLVLDEAHHLEDVTTDHFGATVTARRIEGLLRRLQNPRFPERGVLPALREKLLAVAAPEDRLTAMGAARWIDDRLRSKVPVLADEVERCFERLRVEVGPLLPQAAEGEERRLRIVAEVRADPRWNPIEVVVRELIGRLGAFAAEVEPVLARIERLSPAGGDAVVFLSTQLQAVAGRLAATALDLGTVLDDTLDLCRWLALPPRAGRGPGLALSYAPVEAGPALRDSLFETFDAVVLTSATLSVERRFDYFMERVGLRLLDEGRVSWLRLESPFHFADQALVGVPADLPAPDAPGYEDALHEIILRTVEASRGGAFVLFTSYAALDRAHRALSSRLRALRLTVHRQGEAARSVLLERFRREGSSVLFATDSFWEGVDVRGESLRALVIARLPFRVPTEPIVVARSEAIEARGGSPFLDYALPQSIIRLRQGFGRLIRSHDDAGVAVIADSRVVRKAYGEAVLGSLPPARLAIGSTEEVLTKIAKFFR